MRTTVNLEDDVAAALERLRRQRSMGVSEAVNELIRRGLVADRRGQRFTQHSHDMDRGIDYSNVADAIETLDGPSAR